VRRFAAAIVITVIGLFLTLTYKSSPIPRVALATSPAPTTSALPGDLGVTPPISGPPPSDTPTTSPLTDTPTTAPPTTAAPPPPTGRRTVTGAVIPTRYGDVQVAVVLNGTHIDDVNALQLPFDRARSQFISQQAAPILRQEVLTAQSAQIDTVSGASYTSDGYAQSVQSALDQAHA
jgi:uncharacterized protein with FMN-binding domain